jgi:hypothetical protein
MSSDRNSPKPLPPGIHIILGDSAGGIFMRVFRARERLLIDQDVLCCGPTPKCDDLRAWSALRLDYWMNLVPGGESGHIPAPNNLVSGVERLRGDETIHVWAATSLSEQLFIAHVVRLVDLVGADPTRIALVQFESLRNRRARILGMGELNEESMSDHPKPQQLSDATRADYRAAWSALTSEDPTAIERFAADRPNANAWLKQAMRLMLRRFPDKRTGLTHWDHKLLSITRKHAPRAARIIGAAITDDMEDADLTGDWYLFGRLQRLGDERLPQPLLKLTGDKTSMRNAEVALTPFGEAVLDGTASNYPTNPIDDWAGGVRLSSANGAVWFNDGERIVRG